MPLPFLSFISFISFHLFCFLHFFPIVSFEWKTEGWDREIKRSRDREIRLSDRGLASCFSLLHIAIDWRFAFTVDAISRSGLLVASNSLKAGFCNCATSTHQQRRVRCICDFNCWYSKRRFVQSAMAIVIFDSVSSYYASHQWKSTVNCVNASVVCKVEHWNIRID